MRTNLKVPYAEKDEAKRLGARWDPARKLWYVKDVDDLSPFARWSPTPAEAAGPAASAPAKAAASSAGIVVTGRDYVEHAPVCTCPPWEDCERCRGLGLPRAG